ncbi:B3 domain-containing protein [Apostasia shenzhenica]|uniref:B3 domain-containing protein n=1 Tax=Apostasia shenzhenica TaxID=1088818 RepID=A0A2I0AJK8_9ASPA|nr:B3 domain-containing protein [Apostasia shenzhenica]
MIGVRRSKRLLKQSQDGCLSQESTQRVSVEAGASFSQAEIFPLQGKPYFTYIIWKYQINKPFYLVIPANFHQFLPSCNTKAILWHQSKEWVVDYVIRKTYKVLNGGWRKFATDNNLRLGDACVFELMDAEKVMFRVQILDGQLPERREGVRAEIPILID